MVFFGFYPDPLLDVMHASVENLIAQHELARAASEGRRAGRRAVSAGGPAMMPSSFDLAPVVPEMFVAITAMVLLMFGVFRGDRATRAVAILATVALGVALVLVLSGPQDGRSVLAGMFVADPFATFMKSLVLVGSGLAIVMSYGYIRRHDMERFEFPILILLATLGMMMMVSANDLISLYVGTELQSLSLYVLAAFQRDSLRSTEAGLKYFVLGALSSGLLLYGCSLIYGFTGSTSFEALAGLFAADEPPVSVGLIIGLVFLIAGLAFKVSAVPFHMWTPDVYEGAPTPITAFFAVAPKIAAMALFLRAIVAPFSELAPEWQQIIILISIASMLLGAFAAIGQSNIKRLMAYSSIGHVGSALIGLAAETEEGFRGVLIYMTIYLVMNIGAFACIPLHAPQGTAWSRASTIWRVCRERIPSWRSPWESLCSRWPGCRRSLASSANSTSSSPLSTLGSIRSRSLACSRPWSAPTIICASSKSCISTRRPSPSSGRSAGRCR